MSVATTQNWSIINHSPLNNSISKQCFSIPKAKRFANESNSICTKAFYELPPVRSHRKAGFGYGLKYDFTKAAQKTPAPNVYVLPSDFKEKGKGMRGISFGVSRDKMSQFGILGNSKKQAPGPGAYDNISYLSKVSFSIRPRTNLELSSFLKVPGPGAYDVLPSITTNGKHPISKYKGSCATMINPARSSRFEKNLTKSDLFPGPGYYDPKISITPEGKYFLSTFKDSKCRTIGHQSRKDLTSEMTFQKTPGPGSYRVPSEFGYYETAP